MCSTDTNKTKGKTQLEGSDQPSLRFCVGGLGNLEWQRCPVECCMGLPATRLDHLRKLCYAQPSSFARNQRGFCRRIIDSPLAEGSMDVWMLSPFPSPARPLTRCRVSLRNYYFPSLFRDIYINYDLRQLKLICAASDAPCTLTLTQY